MNPLTALPESERLQFFYLKDIYDTIFNIPKSATDSGLRSYLTRAKLLAAPQILDFYRRIYTEDPSLQSIAHYGDAFFNQVLEEETIL